MTKISSDMDSLIQSLEQLITKKRQIKQGAMQTLLNPYDENGRAERGVGEKVNLGKYVILKWWQSPSSVHYNTELVTAYLLFMGNADIKKVRKTIIRNYSSEAPKTVLKRRHYYVCKGSRWRSCYCYF